MAQRYFPVEADGEVTSPYGSRTINGRTNFHYGTDFGFEGDKGGQPVYAVQAGTVLYAGAAQGYGGPDPAGWLVIDSDDDQGGGCVEYGHIVREVKVGDTVAAGQRIAHINPDRTTNAGVIPHCHLAVHVYDYSSDYTDPIPWLGRAQRPNQAPTQAAPAPQPQKATMDFNPGQLLADYSAGVPTAQQLKDAGFVGAIRYTSAAREPWMKGKPLSRAEADGLKALGMAVVSNYQFAKGGSDTADWIRGADGGKADVALALKYHRDAGGPDDAPIYFSIDAAPNQWEIDNQVLPYLRAVQDVIGKPRMGVYCNPTVIEACLKAGIGTWFWEHGWGGNKDAAPHPAAHIKQFEIDKAQVNGIGVDRNRVVKVPFGAWGQGLGTTYNPSKTDAPTTTPAPTKETTPVTTTAPAAVRKPGGYPVSNGLGIGVGYSDGCGRRVRIYIHTTENQDWVATAEAVAQYQARQQDGSYHDLIDDKHILNTVRIGDTAWGVLSDNAVSYQIALVMTSGAIESWQGQNPNTESRPKSREQWLKHVDMLDMLAWRIADIARKLNLPLDKVDIVGVGQNRAGVSSHNTYTYGSVKLKGYKDGTHWDVPLSTFPIDDVLNAARAYAGQPAQPVTPPDPNAYPLAWSDGYKEYWGPLDGPEQSISNLAGTESQASKDGLKRWQGALGLVQSGVYDNATRDAATRMQKLKGWPVTGFVWKGEWDAVIREGWRFPADPTQIPAGPSTQLPPVAPVTPPVRTINPGLAVSATKKIADVTGPGHSDRWGVGGTDLGVMCRMPDGRILAIFGDTFSEPHVGRGDWRAPVGLISETTNLDEGITWSQASGPDRNYARQLWNYIHDNANTGWTRGGISTVLPSDVVVVGNTIYLHVMVNKGFGNVVWTEIWRSDDNGGSWTHTGAKFDGGICHGLAQLWTWDLAPDGYVYVMSTGFQRDKPLILRRVPADKIAEPGAYEGWGWANGAWGWGNDPTPVLEKVTSGERFGEMSLRWIQGQWVLVNFDASSVGGYDIDVRVFANITDNLYDAKKSTPIRGVAWGQEGDDAVAQLYGPSVVPGSTLDGGFHIFVSQWNTGAPDGWPYRAMQFKIPISPIKPVAKSEVAPTPPASEVPVTGETKPVTYPPAPEGNPNVTDQGKPAGGPAYTSPHSTGSFWADLWRSISQLFGGGKKKR